MAKASVQLKEGAKIIIEGTPKEIASLVARLKDFQSPKKSRRNEPTIKHQSRSKEKATPMNLIVDLIDGGFFKKPRELSAIKLIMQEQGFHYPITSLSPTVLRLVRKHQLRRIKDKKRWLYVQ
ncbi:MAG: hypothetical protein HY070_07850 [Chloroflexi bacterium]|nr:hypothetical protein [Chloroflexota bacterium]